MDKKKLFIGNVPYYCSKREFETCFEKYEGYLEANLKKKYTINVSRGFGIVTFKNEEDARRVLEKEIKLKGRVLRITYYNKNKKIENNEKIYNIIKKNKKLIIKNIEREMKYERMKEILKEVKYKKIKITIYEEKANCVLYFENNNEYKKYIGKEYMIDNKKYIIEKYDKKKRILNDPILAYNEGYKAGEIIGYQKGVEIKEIKKNIK